MGHVLSLKEKCSKYRERVDERGKLVYLEICKPLMQKRTKGLMLDQKTRAINYKKKEEEGVMLNWLMHRNVSNLIASNYQDSEAVKICLQRHNHIFICIAACSPNHEAH